MKVIGVIPSRYASTRLPAKPLALIAGKPLVQWVWEGASRASSLDELLIATDDDRIADLARSFGAKVVMTPVECASGTDRIASAVADMACDLVVNIQGDEPLMTGANIDACVSALANDEAASVSTPMVALHDPIAIAAPHVVKVVSDAAGYALYFSRAPIPDRQRALPGDDLPGAAPAMKHLGLYVYRYAALNAFTAMPPSRYERLEKLEQLRFLEAGYRIRMVETNDDSIGVDTPADVAEVEAVMAARRR